MVAVFINCLTLSIGLWSSAWASFVPLLLRYCCAYLFYSNSIWAANLVRFVIVIQHLKGNFHNFQILNRKCEQQEHFCIMSCSSYCSVLRAQWVPAWCCAQSSIFSRVPKSILWIFSMFEIKQVLDRNLADNIKLSRKAKKFVKVCLHF